MFEELRTLGAISLSNSKNWTNDFKWFSLALDESAGAIITAQLFTWGKVWSDWRFTVYEKPVWVTYRQKYFQIYEDTNPVQTEVDSVKMYYNWWC